LLIVMTEDLQGIKEIDAIAALDGVDLISLGPTDLSAALGITDPSDPRLRQTIEELVHTVNRIGKAKVYVPVYHPAFYLTPKDLRQLGVHYTSVAPPPPTVVLNALRESATRIREETDQRGGR
jgi:2-keto-3-deoxy-L-rhamnonate aldolase RhmA